MIIWIEKDVILPINKCIDKYAKFYFQIKVNLIEEIGNMGGENEYLFKYLIDLIK